MVSDQVYGCNNYRAITPLAAGHSTAGDQIHQCKQVSSLPKEICPAIHLYILCNSQSGAAALHCAHVSQKMHTH